MEKIGKVLTDTTPASTETLRSTSVLAEPSIEGTALAASGQVAEGEGLVELLLVGTMPPLDLLAIDPAAVRPRFAADRDSAIQAVIESRPDLILVSLALPDDGASKFVVHLRKMQLDGLERASLVIGIQEQGDAPRQLADDHQTLDGVAASDAAAAALREWIARVEQQRPVSGIFWIERHIADSFPGYLGSRRKLAANLVDALRCDDREASARSAHMLAGSPGFHGFDAWVRFCREIEQWARNGSGPGSHHLERAGELARLLEQPLVQ
jgi:CheY-like chemotaxis protein